MNNDVDLPADRPMPVELQEHMWNQLRPRVAATLVGGRRRSLALPLSVAAAVGVLVSGVLVFGPDGAPKRVAPAADPADVRLTEDCVKTTATRSGVEVPDPESWQPAVKIDVSAETENGAVWPELLVIRNDKAAALCLVAGSTTGGITGARIEALEGRDRHSYATLTASRPFDYFDAWNFFDGGSVQFGIATDDVVEISVVGQDNAVTLALLHNGAFAVKIGVGESCGRPIDPDPLVANSTIRATLRDGQVVEGPLCEPAG